MSTVMHPDGQEPQNTFWMRRVVVGLAALLALLLLWWVLSSLFGHKDNNNNVVTANPQNPTSLAGTPTPSSSPSDSTSPSATASTSPSSSATDSASATATSSASASATAAAPSASGSASATGAASTDASGSPSATASSVVAGQPTTCTPSQVQLAMKGDRSPKIGQPTTLGVTFTNSGKVSCYLNLAKQPVTIAITSGADHIWSTSHCAAWGARGILELEPGKSHTWSTPWTTQRSGEGCTLKKTPLGAGTYVATASMAGGNQAHLVMALHH